MPCGNSRSVGWGIVTTVAEDCRAARVRINQARNERRKLSRVHYNPRNGSHRRAKELRREFGGAFGKSPERLFNFLAQGTGASERRVTGDNTDALAAKYEGGGSR